MHVSRDDDPVISVPALGLELRVRVPPAALGGGLTAIETTNAPSSGPPLHRHREAEVFRVLEGRYLFVVGGERFHAQAGDVVAVPGGVPHAFANVTDRPARQFVLIVPGLDAAKFFTELGEVTPGGSPDPDALAAFGVRWQVEFLGPPLDPATS